LKPLLFILTILFLTGCHNKTIDRFKTHKATFAALQQTKKIALLKEGEVDTLISATYLLEKQSLAYGAKNSNKGIDERFVVGIFFSDANATLEDLNITLNNQSPITIKKVESSDKCMLTIPMLNSWSNYYLIAFNPINQNTVELAFEKKGVEKKNKKFHKVARYLLEPK